MMVGTNLNESALFMCAETPNLSESEFRQRLGRDLEALGAALPEEIDLLVALYNASKYDDGKSGASSWKRAYVDLHTDMGMFCDSRFVLDAVQRQGQPAYAYLLEKTTWFFEAVPCLGTPHMTDLFFLWQNFDIVLKPDERALGARMAKHWANFAWNHAPKDQWPTFGGNRNYLRFNAPNDTPDSQIKKEQCDIFEAIRSRNERPTTVVVV
jgi:carboxylesterase type B